MKLTSEQLLNLLKDLINEEMDKKEALLESPVNKKREAILEQKLNKLLKKNAKAR